MTNKKKNVINLLDIYAKLLTDIEEAPEIVLSIKFASKFIDSSSVAKKDFEKSWLSIIRFTHVLFIFNANLAKK